MSFQVPDAVGPEPAGYNEQQACAARATRLSTRWHTTRTAQRKGAPTAATLPPAPPTTSGIGTDTISCMIGIDNGSTISTTKLLQRLLSPTLNHRQREEDEFDLARMTFDRSCAHTGEAKGA